MERDARFPPQLSPGFAGIAKQRVNLGRPKVARVKRHNALAASADPFLLPPKALPFQRNADSCRCRIHELTDRVLFAGSDYVVLWLGLLQHEPLRFHVVSGMTPIALGIEISQIQTVL